jgi:hypothetical protein
MRYSVFLYDDSVCIFLKRFMVDRAVTAEAVVSE